MCCCCVVVVSCCVLLLLLLCVGVFVVVYPTQIFTSYIRNAPPTAPEQADKPLGQAKGDKLKAAKPVKVAPATGTIPRKKLADRDPSCKCTGHKPKGQADSSSYNIADCLCRDCRCQHRGIFVLD
jgi:hypothetical protein